MTNGNQIVKELVEALSAVSDLTVTPSSVSKKRRVFQLDGRFNGFIFLHGIAKYPHHWGITENTMSKIESQHKPWAVILLHDSKDTGYIISSVEAHNRIAKSLWPFKQGDYKITEGKSLVDIPHFSSVNELLDLLPTQLTEMFSVKSAIQNAIRETEQLRRRITAWQGCESSPHKELKEYVASHPEVLGLEANVVSFLEFSFPSGDQADIAFDLGNNHWTVVEIELGGSAQTLIGLFQAVKYRALQRAVLTVQGNEGKVDGFLVAHSIPEETKRLAGLLGIKIAEVTI